MSANVTSRLRGLSGRLVVFVAILGVASVGAGSAASAPRPDRLLASSACSGGYVDAQLSWGEKCLRTGEYCKVGNLEYHAYGFDCPASGYLTRFTGSSAAAREWHFGREPAGLSERRRDRAARASDQDSGCVRGTSPDRRCSPGAYYSGLTKAVICSPSFRTSTIRNVPQSEKYAVEIEYGMPARLYGRTIEIDHIVSLELGGSNDIANLYPEPGTGVASYHVKDKLENKLHDLVCSGADDAAALLSGRSPRTGRRSTRECSASRRTGLC